MTTDNDAKELAQRITFAITLAINNKDTPFLENMMLYTKPAILMPIIKMGILVRAGSFWVGAHYSGYNRRWCINIVPCITIWITLPGGKTP